MFIEVYTSQLIDIPELALSLRISSIPWMLLNPEKSEDNQMDNQKRKSKKNRQHNGQKKRDKIIKKKPKTIQKTLCRRQKIEQH